MSNDMHLSDTELALFNKLEGVGDVSISVLFRTLKKRWPKPEETNRVQQRFVCAYITRINRKIAHHRLRILPGEKRASYRVYRQR